MKIRRKLTDIRPAEEIAEELQNLLSSLRIQRVVDALYRSVDSEQLDRFIKVAQRMDKEKSDGIDNQQRSECSKEGSD